MLDIKKLFNLNVLWLTSPTPRIGTKRHWVCLDVPDKVVPKDEEEEEYEKKARLGLTTLDTGAEDCTDTGTFTDSKAVTTYLIFTI